MQEIACRRDTQVFEIISFLSTARDTMFSTWFCRRSPSLETKTTHRLSLHSRRSMREFLHSFVRSFVRLRAPSFIKSEPLPPSITPFSYPPPPSHTLRKFYLSLELFLPPIGVVLQLDQLLLTHTHHLTGPSPSQRSNALQRIETAMYVSMCQRV